MQPGLSGLCAGQTDGTSILSPGSRPSGTLGQLLPIRSKSERRAPRRARDRRPARSDPHGLNPYGRIVLDMVLAAFVGYVLSSHLVELGDCHRSYLGRPHSPLHSQGDQPSSKHSR